MTRLARHGGTSKAPDRLEGILGQRLRDLGIKLSSMHRARISIEVDCVGVRTASGSRALATPEHVHFSELVLALSMVARPTSPTDCGKWVTNTCAGLNGTS